ncbi:MULTISPECIES: site-specific integrase [Pirellulaceae]|uniref:site-specific integrase n=1 Tax=Pirellulaceae TaxID=2691357 RepID=UPI001304F65C|nr:MULTISPECIES: site-specific integrase [Pirellulaceae]
MIQQPNASIIQFRRPELDPTQTGACLSVFDFYQRYAKPQLKERNRSADTIGEYERHLRRWQDWQAEDRMHYPVLAISDVRHTDLEAWRKWLIRSGISQSNRSCNKHLGSLHAVLKIAGQREAHASPPHLSPLECSTSPKKPYLTYDQVGALYLACKEAQWPVATQEGYPLPYSPAVYWRAFIVLQFNYGQRTQELASYERKNDSLTWRQICWEPETPAEEGSAINPHGWFFYVPQKQKRFKEDPLVLPLNETSARHLRSIMPPGRVDPNARVFPFPYSNESYYETWDAIVKASGVKRKKNLKTGERPPVHIKLFRKTCETWHDTHAPGMGEIITGHAERTVSGKHYANRERRLVETLNAFPQPAAFLNSDQQQLLF